MDDLKAFCCKKHDGIVFDDMSFTHIPVDAQKHLLDWTQDRSIHCRFVNAIIPARTRKIFLCNPEAYPFSDDPAVRSRIHDIKFLDDLPSHRTAVPANVTGSRNKVARALAADTSEAPVEKKSRRQGELPDEDRLVPIPTEIAERARAGPLFVPKA